MKAAVIAGTMFALCLPPSIGIAATKRKTAPSTPIESDAVISNDLRPDQVQALAALTRLHGYRCDSVSAVHPFVFSHGFTLVCNSYRYKFEIEDKGGNYTVTVK